MHPEYQQMMMEAARLTQRGDLGAATALIQKALNGASAGSVVADAQSDDGGAFNSRAAPGVIDVEARELDDLIDEGGARSTIADPAVDPGSFMAGTFTHRSAQRNYKLYVPSRAGEQPLPLVVMLHGCTQDPDDFALGTGMNEAALEKGFFVLYPEQSQKMNPQRCWNWFKHTHQKRGRGEPALLAGMTRDVMARHSIDPSRVYVAGLSAGGAMAAILGDTYPDLFAAVGVHSGLAAGAATDLPSAFSAMQSGGDDLSASVSGVPTIVFHGDADYTVNRINADQVIAASIGREAVLASRAIDANGSRRATRQVHVDAAGKVTGEIWTVHGAPHAWSGGSLAGSFTDPAGPSATTEMLRFFFDHTLRVAS